MAHITAGSAFSEGWKKFAERGWYLFGLTLAVGALCILVSGNTLLSLAGLILYAGYLGVLLRHFNGKKAVFDDLAVLDNRWISFLILCLVKGILVLIGLVCLVIPGIYLAVRWMFAELLVIDQGLTPIAALRVSSKMTQGHWWPLFGFCLLALLALIVGVLALVAGSAVAYPVVILATIALYENLKTHHHG